MLLLVVYCFRGAYQGGWTLVGGAIVGGLLLGLSVGAIVPHTLTLIGNSIVFDYGFIERRLAVDAVRGIHRLDQGLVLIRGTRMRLYFVLRYMDRFDELIEYARARPTEA